MQIPADDIMTTGGDNVDSEPDSRCAEGDNRHTRLVPQCFHCAPRAYIGYVLRVVLRSARVPPSENIAGDTHLVSQNNYGKLEQSYMGRWPDSPSAQRESGSETNDNGGYLH